MRLVTIILISLLLVAGRAQADTTVRVVHAGHLVDVVSGKVLANQAIRIEGERITAIEPWREPGAGVEVIDWSARWVVPGLMDMHAHLVGDDTSAELQGALFSSAARDALGGVKHARATLHAGFTAVRDIGTFRAFVDTALRDAIDTGIVPGPRMMCAVTYITVSSGGGEVVGNQPDLLIPAEMRRGVANSADEVRMRVRELLHGGADFIKMIVTGAVLTEGTVPGASEYTEAEIRAAVEEAAQYDAFVAAHAHGPEGIKRAVRAGVRSIEHGSLIDDEGIALMKKHGTWLVADIYNGDYIEEVGTREGWSKNILRKNEETTDAQRVGFRKAVKAGVNIAYGTDSGVYPHGWNARQFAYMVRYGMTPLGALRSATIDSARLMGKEKDIGSIEAGKYADLVAVDSDPLADITVLEKVSGVIKGGDLIR